MDENSRNFWRKLIAICRKIKDNQHLKIISIRQGRKDTCLQNFAHLDQKIQIFFKILRKFWDFLIKISMENWLFHNFSLNFSMISASSPKVYTFRRLHHFLLFCSPLLFHCQLINEILSENWRHFWSLFKFYQKK